MAYCGVWCLAKQAGVGGGGSVGELYQHFECSTCQIRSNLNILLLHAILWCVVCGVWRNRQGLVAVGSGELSSGELS